MQRAISVVLLVAAAILCAATGAWGDEVPIPEPTAMAQRYYESGVLLWVISHLWALAVPAGILLSGLSAKFRTWAQPPGRPWPAALAIYVVLYSAAAFVFELPLSFYDGFVRPHAYGLSTETTGQWFANSLKSLIATTPSLHPIRLPGIVLTFVFLLGFYSLLKWSPRRWWLWAGAYMLPFIALLMLIVPVVIAPMFNRLEPIRDPALEAEVLRLAERAGVEGSRVYRLDLSRSSTTLTAYVNGLLGAKHIVLGDTTIDALDQRELMTVVGHELGHYVLGHRPELVLFLSGLLLATFFLVRITGEWCIRRYNRRFRFDRASDLASWPLMLVLMNFWLLVFAPAEMGFLRSREREADRFALEITRDNQAMATAILKFEERNLYVPRGSWFPDLWRATHPSAADRVEFANTYRPWESGQPLTYARYITE